MFLVYSSILVCLNDALNVYHDIIVIGKIKIMIYKYSNYHEEQMWYNDRSWSKLVPNGNHDLQIQ
jgi:hypothetical protein